MYVLVCRHCILLGFGKWKKKKRSLQVDSVCCLFVLLVAWLAAKVSISDEEERPRLPHVIFGPETRWIKTYDLLHVYICYMYINSFFLFSFHFITSRYLIFIGSLGPAAVVFFFPSTNYTRSPHIVNKNIEHS